jgi:hypothetical protein
MIRLRCKNCETEMLIPKGERTILECEKCGGHLEIVEELFKKEEKYVGDFHGTYKWWEDWTPTRYYGKVDSGTYTLDTTTVSSGPDYYYEPGYNTARI